MAWDGRCAKCRRLMSICICYQDEEPVVISSHSRISDHQEKRYLLEALVEMHRDRLARPGSGSLALQCERNTTLQFPKQHNSMSQLYANRTATRANESKIVEKRRFSHPATPLSPHKDRSCTVPRTRRGSDESIRRSKPQELPAFDAKRFVSRYYRSQNHTFQWDKNLQPVDEAVYYPQTSPSKQSKRNLGKPPTAPRPTPFPVVWEL